MLELCTMALPLNATGINVSHLFFPDAHPGVGQFSLGAIVGLGALVAAIILFTIVGNILVIIAVLTSRALSPPQNLFLVSLAIADILVATLVMPFSLANELMGYWYFGTVWCDIYLALDVLFCTSSIVHLCAISLDRYWSVTKAVEYNLKRTPKRIKCVLVVVWLISAMISFPPLISMDREPEDEMRPLCRLNDETWYILLSCVGSFFAPCLIMILVYVRIYQVAKRRTRSLSMRKEGAESASQAQEGVGRGTSIKANEEKENGHCPSGQQTGTEMEDMELEESSTSEGKEQEKDRAAGEAGSGEDGRESGRASTSKKEKEVCKKDSYSKRSSRMSRSSNRSFVFSTRRKRRSDRMSKNKVSQAREKRFTFVLAVVMGAFVLCWFPFFFSYSLYGVCRQACEIPKPLFKFFFWIGYCNSSLNPVIYTIFNQDFRRAFKNIVCHRRKRTF